MDKNKNQLRLKLTRQPHSKRLVIPPMAEATGVTEREPSETKDTPPVKTVEERLAHLEEFERTASAWAKGKCTPRLGVLEQDMSKLKSWAETIINPKLDSLDNDVNNLDMNQKVLLAILSEIAGVINNVTGTFGNGNMRRR